MSVIIGGTIAIDNVITPKAEAKNLLGGSAAYAALSASYFEENVTLVGIIGEDFPQEHITMLESHNISFSGVERSSQASFTWTGEYHANMNDRDTHHVALNVLENWQVKLPEEITDAEMVLLANMSPQNQLEMLEQCTSDNRFVIADTMDLWINIANEQLHEVISQLDLFVLNDSEAQLLSGTNNIIEAAGILLEKGSSYLIIKLGEFGAYLFDQKGNLFKCPSLPLVEVNDPTGAGDTFVGAIAGYLSQLDKTEFGIEDIKQGMLHGSVLASLTCQAFSTKGIEALEQEDITAKLKELHKISSWEIV